MLHRQALKLIFVGDLRDPITFKMIQMAQIFPGENWWSIHSRVILDATTRWCQSKEFFNPTHIAFNFNNHTVSLSHKNTPICRRFCVLLHKMKSNTHVGRFSERLEFLLFERESAERQRRVLVVFQL